ncbi:MAG: hypothetical protein ABMA64_29645 [Myxococcota bacterium]
MSSLSTGVDDIGRGFRFLNQHPRLWGWVIAPAIVTLLILIALVAGVSHLVDPVVDWATGWLPGFLRGLASAAVTRRDDMVRCIRSFEQRGGEVPDGRFTIKVTVSPGDGAGVVSTEVVNGSDDVTLGDCLQLTMEDVKFASPEHDFSMMWPIPLPSGDP